MSRVWHRRLCWYSNFTTTIEAAVRRWVPSPPKLPTVLPTSQVKFVTFDFTTDATTKQAIADAEALGVAGTYSKNAPQTGFALVYDTKTQKVVSKLNAAKDATQWSAVLTKQLGGS